MAFFIFSQRPGEQRWTVNSCPWILGYRHSHTHTQVLLVPAPANFGLAKPEGWALSSFWPVGMVIAPPYWCLSFPRPNYLSRICLTGWTSLQGRNRDSDVENKRMDTKAGKWPGGVVGGWGGGRMNWEIGIDIYTLICIKWITNKNLLYKKINKIKFKNSENNFF